MAFLGKYLSRAINPEAVAIVLQGNARIDLAVSTAAAQTAVLPSGVYDVWCGIDVYIKVDSTANDVTTANGYLLRANNTVPIVLGDGDRIGAIAGAAGTLSAHKVS